MTQFASRVPSQIKGSFGQCFLNCTKASVSMAGIWEQSSVPLRLGFLSQKRTRRPVSSLCWETAFWTSLLEPSAPETLRDSQCEQAQGFQGAVALGDSLLEGKDSIKDETYASNISTVRGAIRMSTEWPLSCEAHSRHQTQTQSINYRQRVV